MKIIFAMAGASSRFAKAGYTLPKYQLELGGKSVFYHAINGFRRYFDEFELIFVYRNINDTKGFIKKECEKLGVKLYRALELKALTQGQAQSVYEALCALQISDDEGILIFNIDTFRLDFSLPQGLNLEQIDGYLEVFRASGEQWSFVLPSDERLCKVARTAEKERISGLCSSGLYYFKKTSDFKGVFERLWRQKATSKGEYFIAPMYNELIALGKDIRYSEILLDKIIFCGTAAEYEALRAKKL